MTDTGGNGTSGLKRLALIRHATAESVVSSDHARRLTDRGVRDARSVGTWLTRVGIIPTVVLVSTAPRALRTAELLAAELDAEPELVIIDELYVAGPREILKFCAQIPDSVACAAVVGHRMPPLAYLLLAGDGVISDFPPSTAAVIDLPGGWDSLADNTGTLVELHTPSDS